MKRPGHRPKPNVEQFFSPPTHGKVKLQYEDIPYLTRPLMEHLHELRPDVAIAGDRGFRVPGVAMFMGWRRRFPGERFPTRDGRLHFARVTSRSASRDSVIRAIHATFERAGLPRNWRTLPEYRHRDPRVAYLDDWSVFGGTAAIFLRAVMDYGLPRSSVTYMTLCGRPINLKINHVIGDRNRNPHNAVWHDDDYSAGVEYPTQPNQANVVPRIFSRFSARAARERAARSMDEYYTRFSAAIAAGKIAA